MLNSPVAFEGAWSDSYEFQECIGEGHAGTVYGAVDVTPEARMSKDVAVKIYTDEDMFNREVQIMKRLRGHPNVMQLLTSHNVGTMAVVMPFYNAGDLHSYVWKLDGLSEAKAAGLTVDLLSALQHVHGLDIIHRDVKPENICIDHNGSAVLTDFDISCKTAKVRPGTLCGSPGYMGPEVIAGAPSSFSSDVFAIGCVAYFMLAKTHPFLTRSTSIESVWEENAKCNLRFGRRFKNLSSGCKGFISSIVVRNPDDRLSAQQASEHLWLQMADGNAAGTTSSAPLTMNAGVPRSPYTSTALMFTG